MATSTVKRNQPYLIVSTASSTKEAKKIASLLVRQRRAACVNVVPGVTSLFWWKGSMNRARECLLIVKTTQRCVSQVKRLIRKHHSYNVPELIGWPIRWGDESYLEWLKRSVKLES